MTQLLNKISSYSPEQFIRFNTAYSVSPPNIGTGGTGNWTLNNDAPTLVSGGPDSTGCWQYVIGGNSDTSPTRYRVLSTTNAVVNPEITDGSFSAGIWFRFTQPFVTTQSLTTTWTFFQIAYKSLYNPMSIIMGNSGTANRGKFATTVSQSGQQTVSSQRVDDGKWHYVHLAFNETASGIYDAQVYLDGQLFTSVIQKTWTPSTVTLVETGNFNQNSVTDNIGFLQLSNLFIGSYSTINATAISEIWAAGNTPPSTRTVKYFNGTNWVDSSAQKVWNGTAWIDWNAKRFDGSTWVNV